MGYVSLGNKLVRNVFTNTHSSNVYLDDAISGWEISENVMSSCHPTLRDDGCSAKKPGCFVKRRLISRPRY